MNAEQIFVLQGRGNTIKIFINALQNYSATDYPLLPSPDQYHSTI